MKKISINIIIGFFVSIILIIISLLAIKPNMTYFMKFNDKIYISQNHSLYSCDNNIISFSKKDDKITIEAKIESNNSYYENKIVYDKETGYTIFAIEGEVNKIFDAIITFANDDTKTPTINNSSKELSYDEIIDGLKYANLLNAKINNIGIEVVNKDKLKPNTQKIICSILSIIIGFILSFLVYPVILFDKIKENKKLAIFSIGLTFILCLSSAFYIFFTLK